MRVNPPAAPVDPWAGTAGLIRETFAAVFERSGVDRSDALVIAGELTFTLCNLFGGRNLYLPRGSRFHVLDRNRQIFAQANGRNTVELARRHGLTERQVQNIVKQQLTAHRAAVATRGAAGPDAEGGRS